MTGRHRPLAVRGAILVLAALGVAAGVYTLAAVPPTADSYYPRCQLHSMTGLHCPGCGTTRALHAALNGRFAQALSFNGLAFVVLPVVGWSLGRSLWSWACDRPPPPSRPGYGRWIWVLGVLLIVYGVARNLPWYPFTLLAPAEL